MYMFLMEFSWVEWFVYKIKEIKKGEGYINLLSKIF